ncbi:outer membrane beta-barrel protein [Parapedobacter deserti]|uniref:Outer membrane beta-barrel protein n=1 Tax=Parapedobacter deserti TaxID=1912957 RepID=A0ABV7JEG5_9SPHI
MKKLFLTMMAGLGVTMAVNAQSTDKGTVIVGGNVSYDYKKVVDVDGNTQHYAILPHVGYFVQNNFALGLGLGYSGETTKSAADVKTSLGEFAVAPYARYYKGDGNVKLFGQLAAPMAWGTQHVDGDKTGTTERYGAALSPGIAYFPSSRLGIELSVRGLYYEYSSQKPEGGSKVGVNEFGLNANSLAPSIGINFYF